MADYELTIADLDDAYDEDQEEGKLNVAIGAEGAFISSRFRTRDEAALRAWATEAGFRVHTHPNEQVSIRALASEGGDFFFLECGEHEGKVAALGADSEVLPDEAAREAAHQAKYDAFLASLAAHLMPEPDNVLILEYCEYEPLKNLFGNAWAIRSPEIEPGRPAWIGLSLDDIRRRAKEYFGLAGLPGDPEQAQFVTRVLAPMPRQRA